jgi:acyl-CoA synthetase (AMP-forming)/AMP-acid ligase II
MKFETVINSNLLAELKQKTLIHKESFSDILDAPDSNYQIEFFFKFEGLRLDVRMKGRLEALSKLNNKLTLVNVYVTHPILNIYALIWLAILLLSIGYFLSIIVSVSLLPVIGIVSLLLSNEIKEAVKRTFRIKVKS